MNIEIDQSGKIEDTSKNTIVGFSNGISKSIVLCAKDKKKIQKLFREAGKNRIYVYRVFAILIFILIKDHLRDIKGIAIDEEYPGKASIIKSYLCQEIKLVYPKFFTENISFKRIGKKSRAHSVAYLTYKGKSKPNIKLKTKDILKFIVK